MTFPCKQVFLPLLAFFFILNTSSSSFAQGQANIWYFGNFAGLDFNGGAPVALTNGQVNTNEGCAAISDAGGNLLFYTDGITVWNRNHVIMPNGTGLMGNASSTQSGVVIRRPGSATIYYLFTAEAQAGPNGIRYNEVDMSLNGGLGDITANKNILLHTPSCEKIVGIRHCNNTDVWVVTHDWNSNGFRAFLVTAAGVNTIPVTSSAGLVATGIIGNTIGQLKGSPDGTKLASAMQFPTSRFELFDFNRSTGVVGNAILFPQYGQASYGVEFSPDGTRLYATIFSPGTVYQFDLCAGSNTAISNSGVQVGVSVNSTGSLQLGPDKKIYVARANGSWLGVINNPNTLGAGCNYVDNGVNLAGRISQVGLPNFVNYYLKPALPPFAANMNCLTGTFTAPVVNLSGCAGAGTAITSLSWNFGDPSSGANNTSTQNNPTHTFSSPGTYSVTLVLNYACGNDTLKQNVTTTSSVALNATSVNANCNNSPDGSASATAGGGTSPYTYSWSNGQSTANATGLTAGNYTITVTDALGCAQTASVTVGSNGGPIANAGNNTIIFLGSSTVLNGSGGNTYSWSPSTGLSCTNCASPTATPSITTQYCVTVTDNNGCTDVACVTVYVETPCANNFDYSLPNAFSPNGDGHNDVFSLQGWKNCVKTFVLLIYDRWGEKVYESAEPSASWNGTYHGEKLDAGVFVYYISATNNNNEAFIKKGNISLLR